MELINISGTVIVQDVIIGVSEVKMYTLAPSHTTWVYGFDVYTTGNTIPICVDRDSNINRQIDYKYSVDKLRTVLIEHLSDAPIIDIHIPKTPYTTR